MQVRLRAITAGVGGTGSPRGSPEEPDSVTLPRPVAGRRGREL